MPGAGWSNASSPGFSGAGACWSAGSSILKTFSVSFNSLAYLSSSGNFEIGSSVLSIPKFANGAVATWCKLRNRDTGGTGFSEAIMFNPTQIVIQAFVEELRNMYGQIYGVLEPAYPDIIGFVGRLALENIADSDAVYHDMNHTIMVTLVGQEILRCKHTREGGGTPRDWLHFTISLLCHDIGYVRGVCRGDSDGHYVCNEKGDLVSISPGATDASLTPYHVTRSKLFVRERFGKARLVHIDTREIEANIEHTRFPVPEDEQHTSPADYPGLLRAA